MKGLKRFVRVLGASFSRHVCSLVGPRGLGDPKGGLGITLGSFLDHLGITLGSFLNHLGITLGSLLDHLGITLGSLFDQFGTSSEPARKFIISFHWGAFL